MNPLYQQQMQAGFGMPSQPVRLNPFQQVTAFWQAMRNPAAFMKSRFPDIPNEISNDPNQILGYLQQTRGITDQDLQQLYNTHGGVMMNGYR